MQPRRVILLFAIVLGVSALAASIAPRQDEPRNEDRAKTPQPRERPTARPRPGAARPLAIELNARAAPVTRTVRRGRQVILSVAVPEAGQVSLAGLGEVRQAERGTPAVFDLLPSEIGRFDATFASADGGAERRVGTLVVTR